MNKLNVLTANKNIQENLCGNIKKYINNFDKNIKKYFYHHHLHHLHHLHFILNPSPLHHHHQEHRRKDGKTPFSDLGEGMFRSRIGHRVGCRE